MTMRTLRRAGSRRTRAERGIALVMTLFAIATLLMTAAGALLAGSSGIRATRNYRGATQVHFGAEAGISESLQTINGAGVVNFQNDVVGLWSAIYGSAPRAFAPLGGFSYSVTPVASVADPGNAGRLIATAQGPEGAENVVVASVVRSNLPGTAPGAIYLAADAATNADFQGNAFAIDGTDHNYTGGAGPGPAVPGISTRNDANTQETIDSLSGTQDDNVQGLGYLPGPPIVPSVRTSPAAPSALQLNQIIDDLIARPGVVVNNNNQINGNNTFGTTAAPQITYFNNPSSVTIKANGNSSGAGIMIVEGDLVIQGSLEFKGLILVRGRTEVGDTTVTGNATVYGSLWTTDLNLRVGGSAIVYYSTQALALANSVGGGGALPAPLRVTALIDCAQVPAGSAGCP
jgi:hypothetical protein